MGKWDNDVTGKNGTGDGPPAVRTLYNRQKHEGILPDEDSKSNLILVQPSSQIDRKLTRGADFPIYTVTSEYPTNNSLPTVPSRKFTPSFPDDLLEGTFVKKWLFKKEVPVEDDLTLTQPVLETLNSEKGPGTLVLEGHGTQVQVMNKAGVKFNPESSSDPDDSSPEDHCEEQAVVTMVTAESEKEALEIIESTPVMPFSTAFDDNVVHPLPKATHSSSDTSTSSSSNTATSSKSEGNSTSTDKDESAVINYNKEILQLFDAGEINRTSAGISTNENQIDEFYSFKTNRGVPLQCSFTGILADLKGFAKTPVALSVTLRCCITRNKCGVDRTLFPNYFLYLEDGNDPPNRILIMTARKRKKSTTSNYLISTDPAQVGRRNEAFVGKVRGNLIGSEFTIYDSGNSPHRFNFSDNGIDIFNYRRELGAVIYESNVFGFKGPRRMKLLIPAMLGETDRCECRPDVEEETILEMSKRRYLPPCLVSLANRTPYWCPDTQTYILNFRGRVTKPSVKNFQFVHQDKPDYVVLQFGRIDDDNFTLDFRYPLCPLQAFGIALTSFDGKIACE